MFIKAAATLLLGASPVFAKYCLVARCRGSVPECKDSDFMTTETERFLSEGEVVHYSDETHTVPRADVVSAVEAAMVGLQNFELLTNQGDIIGFQDLTRNDMILSSSDLDGDFTITGPFVVDNPEVNYEVTCPAGGNECDVAVDF